MSEQIFEAVDAYIADLVAQEDAVLQGVQHAARAGGLPDISVSAPGGKLLHVLAVSCGARRILEIGTLAGYSTIWLARALPPDGRLITIEYDEAHAAVARQNFERAGLQDRIELRVGRALDVLAELEREHVAPFDMVFIDADKPPYAEYLEWAIRLARPGALIVADNVIRDGAVLDPADTDDKVAGARRFNQALAAHPRLTAVILQSVGVKGHDGMAIAVVGS